MNHITASHRRSHLTAWLTLLATALCLLHVAPAVADEPAFEPYNQWYVLLIDGQRSGWSRAWSEQQGEHLIHSEQMHMMLRRGAIEMTITSTKRFTETLDHQPVEIVTREAMGALETVTTLRFEEDRIAMTSEQAGRATHRELPLPDGEWFTPAAASKYRQDQLAQGADTVTLRMLEPAIRTTPVEISMVRGEEANVEVFGRETRATEWNVTMTGVPAVTREFIDHRGHTLKAITQMGGMTITMLAAEEHLARAKIDPPEIMAASLVRPEGTLRNPRRLQYAVYELSLNNADDAEQWTLPSVAAQHVTRQEDGSLRVVIDLANPVAADEDQPGEAHLAATTMLNHRDPHIRKLLTQAMEGAEALDQAAQARRLSQFVFNFVDEKGLDVGLASASEVARTGSGDCTEHAVLLAALLRAADIPSRTVSGLIYVDAFVGQRNVFGYHMWTQAWLVDEQGRGGWVDLDPTLPRGGYDAAHITISTSAMQDGEMTNDMLQMMPMFGQLKIRVVESR